jgi:hypothetical protein
VILIEHAIMVQQHISFFLVHIFLGGGRASIAAALVVTPLSNH